MHTAFTAPDAALLALQCLDLTRLNDDDTEADIRALCRRAQSPFGNVAAVCVWPCFVSLARSLLPASIRVAAVANFPEGALDSARALQDVRQIIAAGGDEIDVVLPYRALLLGQAGECADFLTQVRAACPNQALKVIIESGVLQSQQAIAQATLLALATGADFVKTSTGRTPVSATPEAAEVMLQAIAASALAVGFKASGGLRSVADARVYLELARSALGAGALRPQRLRLGASGLLDDIETVLWATPPAARATHY